MDKDIEESISRKVRFDKTEKNIGGATLQGLLIQAIRDQTKETKSLTKESTSLQNKIYLLTVFIVVLTIILAILGLLQLTKL